MLTERSPLHRQIGRVVSLLDAPGVTIVLSSLCGGGQCIPLFCNDVVGNDTKFCEIDIGIVVNDRLKVIIEIEETDKTPVRLCGKAVASALASDYIYEGKRFPKADTVWFVQIVNTMTEEANTIEPSKIPQLRFLMPAIQHLLDCAGIRMRYQIFYGTPDDFDHDAEDELLEHLRCAVGDDNPASSAQGI